MKFFEKFVVANLVFFLLVNLSFFNAKPREIISPLGNKPQVLSAAIQAKPQKEVIGFLPFWTIKEAANFQYDVLTQIVYMGIEFDQAGNLVKTQAGFTDPTWSHFNSEKLSSVIQQAKKAGCRVVLGIQSYDSAAVEAIANNPLKRKKVIDKALELMALKSFDGINIDLEHGGSPGLTTSKNFTKFVKELTKAVKKSSDNNIVSIDVYADSLLRNRIYQIREIGEIVDQIIIMGYDFHRAASISTGPVAPLRSHSERNLISILASFTKTVPAEKIVLAVPYYGYEWRTTSDVFGASTYQGSGALATYKRTMKLIENQDLEINWDNVSMTPWLAYKDGWQTKQIYFENTYSLSLKYELINQMDAGGVAIWALGYDANRPELWQLLAEKFNRPTFANGQ